MKYHEEVSLKIKKEAYQLLKSIPFIRDIDFSQEVVIGSNVIADFLITILTKNNSEIVLVGEHKKLLQPRMAREVAFNVKRYCELVNKESVYPLVTSEYISPRTAEQLIEQDVNYFDLCGNIRLSFENIFIETVGKKPKSKEERGLKSLFGLKSTRMIRLMLDNPIRSWTVQEISERTQLSLGQVSNIRRSLLDQNYAKKTKEGIELNDPEALLSVWVNEYEKKSSIKKTYYTLLNNNERKVALEKVFKEADMRRAKIMLSGISAARWMAPFMNSNIETYYADKLGNELLRRYLSLEEVTQGANVVIEEPKDRFLFNEANENVGGLKCTSPVQTYLDLYQSGEREQESAEHLKNQILKKVWSKKMPIGRQAYE